MRYIHKLFLLGVVAGLFFSTLTPVAEAIQIKSALNHARSVIGEIFVTDDGAAPESNNSNVNVILNQSGIYLKKNLMPFSASTSDIGSVTYPMRYIYSDSIIADKGIFNKLKTTDFHATNGNIQNLTATNLTATNGNIQNLTATNLTATNGNIQNLTATNLTATNGNIQNITATNLYAQSGGISYLTADNFSSYTVTTTSGFFDELTVGTTTTQELIFSGEDAGISRSGDDYQTFRLIDGKLTATDKIMTKDDMVNVNQPLLVQGNLSVAGEINGNGSTGTINNMNIVSSTTKQYAIITGTVEIANTTYLNHMDNGVPPCQCNETCEINEHLSFEEHAADRNSFQEKEACLWSESESESENESGGGGEKRYISTLDFRMDSVNEETIVGADGNIYGQDVAVQGDLMYQGNDGNTFRSLNGKVIPSALLQNLGSQILIKDVPLVVKNHNDVKFSVNTGGGVTAQNLVIHGTIKEGGVLLTDKYQEEIQNNTCQSGIKTITDDGKVICASDGDRSPTNELQGIGEVLDKNNNAGGRAVWGLNLLTQRTFYTLTNCIVLNEGDTNYTSKEELPDCSCAGTVGTTANYCSTGMRVEYIPPITEDAPAECVSYRSPDRASSTYLTYCELEENFEHTNVVDQNGNIYLPGNDGDIYIHQGGQLKATNGIDLRGRAIRVHKTITHKGETYLDKGAVLGCDDTCNATKEGKLVYGKGNCLYVCDGTDRDAVWGSVCATDNEVCGDFTGCAASGELPELDHMQVTVVYETENITNGKEYSTTPYKCFDGNVSDIQGASIYYTCNEDYYLYNNQCVSVGDGYYSPADNPQRYPCTGLPNNATRTSAGGGEDSCSWACNGSRFDNLKGFTTSESGAVNCSGGYNNGVVDYGEECDWDVDSGDPSNPCFYGQRNNTGDEEDCNETDEYNTNFRCSDPGNNNTIQVCIDGGSWIGYGQDERCNQESQQP